MSANHPLPATIGDWLGLAVSVFICLLLFLAAYVCQLPNLAGGQ